MTIALGLLLSGSGSNAQAIMDRAREGALDADIRLVVANNPSACGQASQDPAPRRQEVRHVTEKDHGYFCCTEFSALLLFLRFFRYRDSNPKEKISLIPCSDIETHGRSCLEYT